MIVNAKIYIVYRYINYPVGKGNRQTSSAHHSARDTIEILLQIMEILLQVVNYCATDIYPKIPLLVLLIVAEILLVYVKKVYAGIK